ncbi:retrovirus-related Pol polyprotein from transposon 17.6 [Trichonephila clavipes]|nr:retrovirus-related Pol polyprotein from transposon 17.6 [Trichonephila clavipes]
MDNNLTYYEILTQLACAYLNGHLTRRALDWFEVLGYRVVEDKATDYAHLKQALSEQFPVVRNRSELETRFYSSSQKHNQKPSDFVYDLLKIHKILNLEMTEEKLIDHIISRFEPKILDYVESGNSAQNTAVRNANDQLLQSLFISGLRNDIRRFVLSHDPLNSDESINAALIEEQNMKLNQIANEERSGLSSAQTENSVLSALADRLEEMNLRVGRLQEASSVTARKSGGNSFNRRENVFKCFYCGIQGHRQAECRKRKRDERAAHYQPPRRNTASDFSVSRHPGFDGRHVHFRESAFRDNYAAPRHPVWTVKSKADYFKVELSAAATEHHRINLQHDYPIKCPIYKIPFNLRNEFRRQITDLEKAGIISKSNSQYNTPALFVKQKEKWRLVLDFRKLNEITLTQDFVIPTLDDILHEISGSNYFSALDMKSAFNQIPLHFADRHKTAFSTPDGDKYEFNRLCFGLKNSPKAFQSIAQEVLGDLLHNGALVYIDDIILFTKTIDEHFELLGRKFKVFTDHKPLAGFLSNKNPSSKILRWKLALEEFNYDIHYIRGSLNSVADNLSRYINNITIALPDSKDLINMQREDSVLSTIIQKIDQNDVSLQISDYFINGEGLLCHLSKRPSRSPRSNTTRKQVCITHCLKAKILESVHSEYGGHLKFFKTYHRLSENFFWQNMYKDTKNFVRSCTICLSRKNVFKILPAPHQPVEQSKEPGETCHMDIFGPLKTTLKVLNNLKDQEASHVELSTRATKQHHYDYKIGSLCFIKTPNIKSNLSPKLRPKFEGPYRVIERFSNLNYRVQYVEQLRKRFNTRVNRMIPFIKRFSYLHLNNLDDLQPDETEVKGIVPSPWYNLRARAGNSAR